MNTLAIVLVKKTKEVIHTRLLFLVYVLRTSIFVQTVTSFFYFLHHHCLVSWRCFLLSFWIVKRFFIPSESLVSLWFETELLIFTILLACTSWRWNLLKTHFLLSTWLFLNLFWCPRLFDKKQIFLIKFIRETFHSFMFRFLLNFFISNFSEVAS